MVGQVCGRVRLSADADPDPGKLVVSQVLNDILQPVVAACASLPADPKVAYRKIDVMRWLW